MKKMMLLIISLMFFVPSIVYAETQALNMKDTVIGVGLTLRADEDKYFENDKQVTVYLFRSPTCSHCHDAIEFFDSIVEEYGDKFKMRSYDCYSNSDNDTLKKRIADFLDLEAPGVPLIVIGKSAFYGFEESKTDKMKQAIEIEYAKKDRYDVIDEMAKGKKEKSNVGNYIAGAVIIVGAIVGVFILTKKK